MYVLVWCVYRSLPVPTCLFIWQPDFHLFLCVSFVDSRDRRRGRRLPVTRRLRLECLSEPERDGSRVPEEPKEERCRQGTALQGPLPMQLQTLLGARVVNVKGSLCLVCCILPCHSRQGKK